MLSVVLLILLIYSFQFRPAFLPRRSTKLQSSVRTWFEQYRTSEVAEKKIFFWGGGFLEEAYRPRNDFELIPSVEMKTRNLVEGSFGSEFPRSVIIA